MTDIVNHPPHYADGWSNGAEVIDITEHLNFNRGNAVKYLTRAGKKAGADELEDLRKVQWYVNREIDRVSRLRGEAASAVPPLVLHDCVAEGMVLDMRDATHVMFTGETYPCYECGTPVMAVLVEGKS